MSRKIEWNFEEMTDEEIDEFFRPMRVNSRKSMAPLFVYLVLEKHSDKQRHLTQKEIIDYLADMPYEICIERKALGRILHQLADSELGICCSRHNGFWMAR